MLTLMYKVVCTRRSSMNHIELPNAFVDEILLAGCSNELSKHAEIRLNLVLSNFIKIQLNLSKAATIEDNVLPGHYNLTRLQPRT